MFGRRSTADEVRELALMALASALQEQVKNMQRRKPRLGGMRAVAAGAVLYTAGRAVAPKVREQLESQRDGDERSQDAYDEDEYEEPQAESRDEDESYDEDEYEEPQAEGRDDDESYDEDEADEEEQGAAERPQRSRSPVGRP